MTYIITAEHIKDFDNTKVTVKKELLDSLFGTNSSVADLQANDNLSIAQLLHCLMIKSGNDAALVLADYIGNGDISSFVEMMNSKAKELGCNNTHFVNPHGLHNAEHYTTAEDIITLTKYAIKLPLFMKICSTAVSDIMGKNRRPLITTNRMINKKNGGRYYYPHAKGIKTGYTTEAGYCLVSSATYNGHTYLCVALGAPTTDASGNRLWDNYAMLDSKAMYQCVFANH